MQKITREDAMTLFSLYQYSATIENMLSLSFFHIIGGMRKPTVEWGKVIETVRVFNKDIADELIYICKEASEERVNIKVNNKAVSVERGNVDDFIAILEARDLLSN